MAIDWGQLGVKTPPGGVVAQLPQTQPNNSVNQGINGLFEGASKAQGLMLGNQVMKTNDQSIQMNEIKLNEAKQANQDKQDLRNASAADLKKMQDQNMSNYEQGLYVKDRLEYEKYKQIQANTQLVLANVADKQADTKSKAYQVQQATAASWGVIADAAYQQEQQALQQGATPEQAQQKAQAVYDLKFAQQEPGTQKDMIKQGLNVWNEHTHMSLMKAAGDAQIAYKEAEESKNASAAQRDDKTIVKLQEKAKTGKLTDADQTLLDNAKARQEASARGAQQMTPQQKISTDVATDRLKTDNLDAKTHRANQQAAQTMLAIADSADSGSLAQYKTTLSNFANSVFGLKLNDKTPFNEAFNAAARQFQVNMQSLMKGQTSDRDMKLMAELGPQITNTAPGRKLMAKMIDYRSNGGINQIAFENAWVNKHGSIDGMDEAWDKFLSTRNDIKVTKTGVNFTKYSRKDWAPFLDENYSAPEQAQQSSPEEQMSQPAQSNNDPLGIR